MVNFAQSFLANLANPAMSKSLFGAGAALGQLPGMLTQKRKDEEEMALLRNMGAVERAEYMQQKAKTPDQLAAATTARDTAMRESAKRSLLGLEAARQAAATEKEKLRIEDIMAKVAVQAGVDPSTIKGRTQAEADREVNRELAQNRLDKENRLREEQSVTQAYYATPEKSRKAFEQNAIAQGFGNVIDALRADKLKDEKFLLEFKNAQTIADENAAMKKAELPKTALRERIESSNIDPQLKEQFLSELDDIKEPNFNANETWDPGERKQAMQALNSLNTAVRNEVSKEVSRKSAIKSDIRSLERQLAKPPTASQVNAFLDTAEKQLNTSWFSDPSEEEIKALAYELAEVAKNGQIKELLEQRRAELGEGTPAPVEEPPEEEEAKTKTIGGYKVKEIK